MSNPVEDLEELPPEENIAEALSEDVEDFLRASATATAPEEECECPEVRPGKRAILYPIRFTAAEAAALAVRFTAGAATYTIPLGVNANEDYWASGDGELARTGEKDLFEFIFSEIAAAIPNGPSYSWSLDGATNRPTLESSLESFRFLFTHVDNTLDPGLLGEDEIDTALGASWTAPMNSKGAWLGPEVLFDSYDQPRMVGVVVSTQGGGSRASEHAQTLYVRDMTFHLLRPDLALVRDALPSAPWNNLEYAGVTGRIGKGCRFRVYDDATVRTVSSFRTYRMRPQNERNIWVRADVDNVRLYRGEFPMLRVADVYTP